jgi:hypothetical protein
MRRELLTPSLIRNFEDEVSAFDLDYLPLKINDRGEHGDSRLQIALKATQNISKLSDVLSEGEQRSLALAGFLAELKEIDGNHGIVIDDPVSSLDHSRVHAVAKRLVLEAKTRQVIIFTHNLFFHHAIQSEAMDKEIPVRTEWISKSPDGKFGIIDDQQRPWPATKVAQRIDKISKMVTTAKIAYNQYDETHRPMVRQIYTMMRETWERIVEEVLFADVINRFRPEVRTLQLRAVAIDEGDRQAVFAGMKRCSYYSGHDQSSATPTDLPKFEDIMRDWNSLELYYKSCRDRKTELESKGKEREQRPLLARVLE